MEDRTEPWHWTHPSEEEYYPINDFYYQYYPTDDRDLRSFFDYQHYFSFLNNITITDNSTTVRLNPAVDITVDAVITTVVFDLFICIFLMGIYDVLRRHMPSVYEGRHRHVRSERTLPRLPASWNPLAWVTCVARVPWWKVRETSGLDAYMFLRYIHMCFKVTLVSGFWGMLILWPVFGTGKAGAKGWYLFSMANVEQTNWRIWVPTIFMWLFSSFVYWTADREQRHFLELRMEFLGMGDADVHPQHHYSLMVELIPHELRSDKALYDYFDMLFPSKVHSACVVLNLPDLETLAARRTRVVRRLEKSIAYLRATDTRPTHVVGRPRIMCCGIESNPIACCNCTPSRHDPNDPDSISRGTRVDSIDYYTSELQEMNLQMTKMQAKKAAIAETGNQSVRMNTWYTRVVNLAGSVASNLKIEEGVDLFSACSNCRNVAESFDGTTPNTPGDIITQYGSFEDVDTPDKRASPKKIRFGEDQIIEPPEATASLADSDESDDSLKQKRAGLLDHFDRRRTSVSYAIHQDDGEVHFLQMVLDTLGFEFFKDGCSYINRHIDVYVESVVGTTMSSTGFVTFIDLVSVTLASSAPLTHKPDTLESNVAPEPRDIIWQNAHLDLNLQRHRETIARVMVFIGALLWSIPLTFIQALCSAESLARVPGFGWILQGGFLTNLVNGYLPVVALLGLILLLPIIFEWIAVHYEKRKTKSDVQNSILGRYFYYQLANIYVTVTAGAIWDSLADILDNPAAIASILGKSLPTVVGYFVSILVTKLLAGLPMVLLRIGELMRFTLLKCWVQENKLTQRELSQVYRPKEILYGWEYPTQLLVIVISFTYACISPIILPVAALYFSAALLIYKKQVLYVYTPAYESGGTMFPTVIKFTLFGLFCGQITFLGYAVLRQGYFQPTLLLPLPFLTLWMMSYFDKTYSFPSKNLSLERARDLDHKKQQAFDDTVGPNGLLSSPGESSIADRFSGDAYRQPVLAEKPAEPLPYRSGEVCAVSDTVLEKLRKGDSSRYFKMVNESMSMGSTSVTSDHDNFNDNIENE